MALYIEQTYLNRGNANWYFRGVPPGGGKEVFKSAKTTDEKTARALLINLNAKLQKEQVHGPEAIKTFADAVQLYLETGGRSRNGGSPRFLGEFDPVTEKWDGLMGLFGGRVISTIKQSDLDAAAKKLLPNGSAATRNRQCYAPFIAVYRHAMREEWCPVREWARPQDEIGTGAEVKVKRNGSFSVRYEHAAKFVLAMSPAPAMLMTTLFYTGCRPIELFNLQADQVNIEGRWITVLKSKTGEPRGVPIHEALVPMLTALKERGGFMFRTPRGKPYESKDEDDVGVTSGGQLKTAIRGARRRSGVTNISPYTGRHTVSTQLVINDVHPYKKDQILGHAVTDMSRLYTDVPQAPLIEAINTLPVVEAWANAPWLKDPLGWAGKLAEGTGKRTDLIRMARAKRISAKRKLVPRLLAA